MMGRLTLAVCVLASLLASGPALAQQQRLRGAVVLVHEDGDATPAAAVQVTVADTGDRDIADDQGLFRIQLPLAYGPGREITVSVNKPGWAIWQPLEGKTPVPQGLLTIRLLPKGSKKFWTDKFIQTFIEDTAERAKLQVKLAERREDQKPVDFGPIIKEWAAKYGFSPEEAKDQIDKWIAEVQAAQEDFYKLGLAAFAEHNFRKASELFDQAGQNSQKQLAAVKKWEAELDASRDRLVEETVRNYRKAGDSHYSDYAFAEALAAYQKALAVVERGQYHELWAEVQIDIGRAADEIARRTEGPAVHRYLAQSVTAYRAALEVRTRVHLPQQWAATQNDLGIALENQAIRTGGEECRQLLTQAVTAFRAALEVYTRKQLPQNWAAIQNNLGNALRDQGTRTGGEEGRQLLAQAVTAYRAALEVYTREQLPQDWAGTQNNLGIALKDQGTLTGGEEGRQLLAQAVTACRAVLEIYTHEHLPQDWARTQNNLGIALEGQGTRTGGEEGRQLLAQAVTAYRAALEVRTREHLPQDWATTQDSLGNALVDQGMRTGGEEGRQLLVQALTAYRAALEVRTREHLPQQWATTQNNLGVALENQGTRTGGEEGRQLVVQAVTAFCAALEVRTREQLPQDWAATENNLGIALEDQGMRTGGEEGRRLLAQAVTAYRAALEVYTRESIPDHWVHIQNNLAKTYFALGEWTDSARSFRNVLKINPDSEESYSTLAVLYHDWLFEFRAAFDLHQAWIERHGGNLSARAVAAEAAFTIGRFADAEAELKQILGDASVSANSRIALIALEVATLRAQGKTEAIPARLSELLDLVSAQPEDFRVGWNWAGTMHFIETDDRVAPVRDWLLSLFHPLQHGDRRALLRAVQNLERDSHT